MKRATVILPILVCLTFTAANAQQYKEDFNKDGNVNIADVITLLLLGRDNPTDPRADYNGDGKYAINDAIVLILAIRDGNLTPVEEPLLEPGDTTVIHGITMVSIPGGTFQMGTEDGRDDWKPVHEVTISPFYMSSYEITNRQYAKYLNKALADGDITASSISVEGAIGRFKGQQYIDLDEYYRDPWIWIPIDDPQNIQDYDGEVRTWIYFNGDRFSVEPGKEERPVIYITWYGAKAFALKYGLDLPTEAEWEYAARGGKQYKYATDDGTLSDEKANFHLIGHPIEVGSYPPNPFGLYDMTGNVWEWCNDWYGDYSEDYYSRSPAQNPRGSLNLRGALTDGHIVRGGCWDGDLGCGDLGCCETTSSRASDSQDYYAKCGSSFRVVWRGTDSNIFLSQQLKLVAYGLLSSNATVAPGDSLIIRYCVNNPTYIPVQAILHFIYKPDIPVDPNIGARAQIGFFEPLITIEIERGTAWYEKIAQVPLDMDMETIRRLHVAWCLLDKDSLEVDFTRWYYGMDQALNDSIAAHLFAQ